MSVKDKRAKHYYRAKPRKKNTTGREWERERERECVKCKLFTYVYNTFYITVCVFNRVLVVFVRISHKIYENVAAGLRPTRCECLIKNGFVLNVKVELHVLIISVYRHFTAKRNSNNSNDNIYIFVLKVFFSSFFFDI